MSSPSETAESRQQIIVQTQPPTAFGKYGKFLILALVLCIAALIGQQATYQSYFSPPGGPQEKYHSLNGDADEKIAIVTVSGAILEGDGFVKQQIDRIRDDEDVVAVVLRIDSPGGTVTGSDYIHHHLKEMVEDADRPMPVVVSMGSICASGGYYIAMAAGDEPDILFAEPATWTGSIGVVIPHYDLSGLLASWEVEDDSIASHQHKLMGSPTRQLSPEERAEERALLQQLVDESFERFKQIVLAGRPELADNPEHLEVATTGRIFSADQALQYGLVDRIGFIDDAVARAAELAGRDVEDLRCVKYDKPPDALSVLMGAGARHSRGSFPLDLGGLLDLTAPRAYYLCTWLPSLLSAH